MTHVFDPTTLREYDIRGRVGDTLSEADAYAIGRGFGTIVARGGGCTVAVGRDGRLSSPALEAALVRGLTESGIEVLRVGLGPTPMLYYAVHELAADGGIMITGSHNPVDYNGFKFMLGTGPFYGPQIQTIGTMSAATDWLDGHGSSREVDLLDRYVARLAQNYDAPPMRVVWDSGNGSAGEAVERLTKLLPGEHHLLFTEIDGNFPNHHPDPTEEKNLVDLKSAVIEHGADVGLAFDGDGDRLGAVDGQGRVVWGDQVLGILAVPVLAAEPGATIIGDIKSSQTLFDRIAELGGQPLMWRTGHSNIKARMRESRVPLAGEMSGHIFFAHDYYGFDDGLYAGVRLLRALGHIGKSLAELKDAIPPVVTTPEMRFQCADTRKFVVIEEVLARLKADGAEVNGIDGARVSTVDGWWLLRASNTQDVLVARAEAKDEAGVARLMVALNAQLAASGVEQTVTAGH